MSDAAPTPQPNESPNPPESPQPAATAADDDAAARKRRRRGSRGGRNRNRSRAANGGATPDAAGERQPAELPERIVTNRPPAEVAERALVRKPKIGDTLPAPTPPPSAPEADGDAPARKRRRRGGRGRSKGAGRPVEAETGEPIELDPETLEKRRGRERKGRPVGRYLMGVHVQPGATQIAVLEGRSLIEHYVSRPQDDALQIHGNIYLGRVQNVLPGMEAAFVDIGTPKNAVLYRGDVQFDAEDVDAGAGPARIEQILKARQSILCQVTKNPIGAKGARLTQEVSLPGRFVVLIPNSSTYGISKRLSEEERKRLRNILDKIKPAEHGLIVRTAAEGATREELERDVARLTGQWERIDDLAKRSSAPTLLYREPDMAVRVIREEFNSSYRGVVIDDRALFEEVRDYVASITPELADRVEYHDPTDEALPLFETHRVHEQLHKALDRKVWLPSGGSLIIERTEALTVIDVNTGKNVGSSSLEETVFRNNLEAAEEVARQLRLRDIGGIIVIDFIDMEIKKNREEVVRVFRDALARDKTRTQVFDISELGLVEMTRKRIGEGLIESMSSTCPTCDGRGIVFDSDLLGS
jgi:ribonuclease E